MRLLVSDTSPINYLAQVQAISILPTLFNTIQIPEAVHAELLHPKAPILVQTFAQAPPEWLHIVPNPQDIQPKAGLHPGELAAIALASQSNASVLLIDDKRGARAAAELGIQTLGTLGILEEAATSGLIDLPTMLGRLMKTNFRCDPLLLRALIDNSPT